MHDYWDFSGKVLLVTGGSRGLGYEMVKAFAQHGADVIIVSRKREACEEVAEEVRAMGRRALAYGCHVGRWRELDDLVETAYAEFGRVDILINNAGMSPLAPSSVDTSEALFDKIIDVNLKGPFRLTALVGSRMAAGQGGCIINISSTGSIRPFPAAAPYCGSKAAINALTEAFAQEFAPKVRVNAILPGPFLTDVSKAWTPQARERVDSALGRPGRPEEVITTALYLASEHSSFTTAALVRVDGGIP